MSCLFFSCPALPCPALPCLSCLVLSYLVLSVVVLFCFALSWSCLIFSILRLPQTCRYMWGVRSLRPVVGRTACFRGTSHDASVLSRIGGGSHGRRRLSSGVERSSVLASVFSAQRSVSTIDTGKKTIKVVPGGQLNINLKGVKANVEIFPTWTDKCEIQVDVINPAWYRLRFRSRIDAMEGSRKVLPRERESERTVSSIWSCVLSFVLSFFRSGCVGSQLSSPGYSLHIPSFLLCFP